VANIYVEVVQSGADVLWQAKVHLVALWPWIATRFFKILDGLTFHPNFDLPGARDFLQRQSYDAIFDP